MRRLRPSHAPSPARGLPIRCETSAPSAPARPCPHRPHAGLPFGVKHRLVRLGLDLAETIHAAHVVHAVHDGAPGFFGNPVPIIESRVTSSASWLSFQPSLPSGRFGTPRKAVRAASA